MLGEAATNVVHYGGVKGFVNSFSKSLAWEWANRGVRVNNITGQLISVSGGAYMP